MTRGFSLWLDLIRALAAGRDAPKKLKCEQSRVQALKRIQSVERCAQDLCHRHFCKFTQDTAIY